MGFRYQNDTLLTLYPRRTGSTLLMVNGSSTISGGGSIRFPSKNHVTSLEKKTMRVLYDSITLTKKLDKDIRSGKMTTFCNLVNICFLCNFRGKWGI